MFVLKELMDRHFFVVSDKVHCTFFKRMEEGNWVTTD